MSFRQIVRNLRKLPECKINNCCPECGGELQPTYSSEVGFCPSCRRQIKYKK